MKKFDGDTVEIMAMSECPNDCEHCFINYKGHINFETLEIILDRFNKIYKNVILNGTELLMNDKYIELCSKYGQDFIYTNGKLLTAEKRNVLKQNGIKRISVSLHYGIQEHISKSNLSEISKVIVDAVNDGFSVRVLCTISKENYKLVPIISEYVKSLGASSLKFINMMKEGKASNFGNIFLGECEIIEFFDLLQIEREKNYPEKFYITRNGGFGNDNTRKNNFNCGAGKDVVVITPEHKVYPCNFLLYDEYCIGYWDETGIYIDEKFEHNPKECKALEKQLIKTISKK
ncbi:MAG: hypothetical protein ACI31V_03305 [Bacilli bacterium]